MADTYLGVPVVEVTYIPAEDTLTLVDIAPNVASAGVDRVVGFMQKHMDKGFASLDEAAEAIAAYTPNRAKRGASDGLKHYLRLGADGRYFWHWDPAFISNVHVQIQSSAERLVSMDEAVGKAVADACEGNPDHSVFQIAKLDISA